MKPIEFTGDGTFEALYKATAWCHENGFSCGSLCAPEPVALMHGEVIIAKWRNLTAKERAQIDGKMTSPNFRTGPVTVEIYMPATTNSTTPTP